MKVLWFTCLLGCALLASAQPPSPPYPNPAKPHPNFHWDTFPIAFHGANKTGMYTEAAVRDLAKYMMVTLEKWYTPCASGHHQGTPACDVEQKMYTTFRQIREASPNITLILYLNSMMDFAFYHLNGVIEAREAAGQHILLRDIHNNKIELCNDGDFYCNVTFFDHSSKAMRDVWTEALMNATKFASVDGVFADHASQKIEPGHPYATLCNGRPKKCYNFTNEFADAFNTGHQWLINSTQDALTKLNGAGPVVDGPYSRWNIPACDFNTLRKHVQAGQEGTGPYVLEASKGGCTPDESCLAAFLCAAEKYTYMACFSDTPHLIPEFDYPLGPPTGPAVEGPAGIWTRKFHGPTGTTIAKINAKTNKGTVQWAGQPPPPPPPPPLPPVCGKVQYNTGMAQHDVGVAFSATGPEECCEHCQKLASCAVWCFHGEPGHQHNMCHMHSSAATPHAVQGATAGVMNRTLIV